MLGPNFNQNPNPKIGHTHPLNITQMGEARAASEAFAAQATPVSNLTPSAPRPDLLYDMPVVQATPVSDPVHENGGLNTKLANLYLEINESMKGVMGETKQGTQLKTMLAEVLQLGLSEKTFSRRKTISGAKLAIAISSATSGQRDQIALILSDYVPASTLRASITDPVIRNGMQAPVAAPSMSQSRSG